MKLCARLALFVAVLLVAGAVLFACPQLDMAASGYFFNGQEFVWREATLANLLHDAVHPLSLALAGLFAAMLAYSVYKKMPLRVPLFLLLSLVIGPGLITNTLLKDNWGRARPLQITEFGGVQHFTPPLLMADQCDHNCSFVGGDAAFGYWFSALGYVIPRRRRAAFWSGMGMGLGYSVLRVGMGAHFLSDVFFAGIVILMSNAAVYAAVFGRSELSARWREFLGDKHA